ncbi:MAG: bifunctional phosphoribosyl-AMP cyclohydrolase/phosphoribosyl-ATP diphosphatase HisIE [Clostridium sp.]|nr:bifunctional phosphoribosyl-AMP cyclohydrolase/phosphoribosyl-ATP diphosphatase HisIE [Clostridium sp.]
MELMLQQLKFNSEGLIPVIAQDHLTNEVLMLAYMNGEAFKKSMETGKVYYFSRSRNKLWLKGETSGHFQKIKSVRLDCDGDTLLIKVEQTGAACHTGNYSCFYREFSKMEQKEVSLQSPDRMHDSAREKAEILQEVYDVILSRIAEPKEGSYTNYLFEKGIDKMLKKVGEEAAEVIIASKNEDRGEVIYEIADLFYHIIVLMVERGVQLDDIYDELKKRR